MILNLYITEWNFTASVRNYLNDSCFGGAYIIKNILDLYGQSLTIVAHYLWQLTVRSSITIPTNCCLVEQGFLPKDGILKPSGFAFDFLNRLYPYYVGHGENYLISTDQHDSYGISLS